MCGAKFPVLMGVFVPVHAGASSRQHVYQRHNQVFTMG